MILTAAAMQDWRAVRDRLSRLRVAMLLRAALGSPLRSMRYLSAGLMRRTIRWIRPDNGFHILLLGPDGCGKSSVAEAVERGLAGAFQGAARRSFPPRLLNRTVGDPGRECGAACPRAGTARAGRVQSGWLGMTPT